MKANIANGKMSGYAVDLLHHVIIDTYKMSDEKTDQMVTDDKLRWYILRGCSLQLRSSTSPFYHTWRKEKMNSRENFTAAHSDSTSIKPGILEKIYEPYDNVIERLSECMHQELDSMHFYLKTLFTKYWFEKWSLTQIHKHYGISKTHVIKDLNEAIRIIREKCADC